MKTRKERCKTSLKPRPINLFNHLDIYMNKTKFFPVALTLALLAGPATAETATPQPAATSAAVAQVTKAQLEALLAASDRGDYAKVLEIVQPLAEAGDDKFQSILGAMYAEGKGVAQDYKKAREWFQKAAAAGNAAAQNYLGAIYAKGQGVEQDYAKAREWYQKAAEAGNANAKFNLGSFYYHGHGVKQDYAKAREWFQKAAAQGHKEAERALQIMKDKN